MDDPALFLSSFHVKWNTVRLFNWCSFCFRRYLPWSKCRALHLVLQRQPMNSGSKRLTARWLRKPWRRLRIQPTLTILSPLGVASSRYTPIALHLITMAPVSCDRDYLVLKWCWTESSVHRSCISINIFHCKWTYKNPWARLFQFSFSDISGLYPME